MTYKGIVYLLAPVGITVGARVDGGKVPVKEGCVVVCGVVLMGIGVVIQYSAQSPMAYEQ